MSLFAPVPKRVPYIHDKSAQSSPVPVLDGLLEGEADYLNACYAQMLEGKVSEFLVDEPEAPLPPATPPRSVRSRYLWTMPLLAITTVLVAMFAALSRVPASPLVAARVSSLERLAASTQQELSQLNAAVARLAEALANTHAAPARSTDGGDRQWEQELWELFAERNRDALDKHVRAVLATEAAAHEERVRLLTANFTQERLTQQINAAVRHGLELALLSAPAAALETPVTLRNYALGAEGAVILGRHTLRSILEPVRLWYGKALLGWYDFVTRNHSADATHVLRPQGYFLTNIQGALVGIRLSETIHLTQLTVHRPSTLESPAFLASAPRTLHVYALPADPRDHARLEDAMDMYPPHQHQPLVGWIRVAECEVPHPGDVVPGVCAVPDAYRQLGVPVRSLRLEITANWGHPSLLSLGQVLVHGTTPIEAAASGHFLPQGLLHADRRRDASAVLGNEQPPPHVAS